MSSIRRWFSTSWRVLDTHTPPSAHCTDRLKSDISELQSFLFSKQRVTCITGAGISTRSGIPDYRGPNGSYSKGHKPMLHNDFISKESARKR